MNLENVQITDSDAMVSQTALRTLEVPATQPRLAFFEGRAILAPECQPLESTTHWRKAACGAWCCMTVSVYVATCFAPAYPFAWSAEATKEFLHRTA